jgi:hypothetical protein
VACLCSCLWNWRGGCSGLPLSALCDTQARISWSSRSYRISPWSHCTSSRRPDTDPETARHRALGQPLERSTSLARLGGRDCRLRLQGQDSPYFHNLSVLLASVPPSVLILLSYQNLSACSGSPSANLSPGLFALVFAARGASLDCRFLKAATSISASMQTRLFGVSARPGVLLYIEQGFNLAFPPSSVTHGCRLSIERMRERRLDIDRVCSILAAREWPIKEPLRSRN